MPDKVTLKVTPVQRRSLEKNLKIIKEIEERIEAIHKNTASVINDLQHELEDRLDDLAICWESVLLGNEMSPDEIQLIDSQTKEPLVELVPVSETLVNVITNSQIEGETIIEKDVIKR